MIIAWTARLGVCAADARHATNYHTPQDRDIR